MMNNHASYQTYAHATKDRMDFSTTEQCSQDSFHSFSPSQEKVSHFKLFQAVQSLHVQHVCLLLTSGGDFQAGISKL